MSDPVSLTFRVLQSTATDVAERLLLHAIQVPAETIQTAAVKALIARNHHAGQKEVLKQHSRLCPAAQTVVRESGLALLPLYRQMLLQGAGEPRELALRRIADDEVLSAGATLLELLTHENDELRQQAMGVLCPLIDRMSERCYAIRRSAHDPSDQAILKAREQLLLTADRMANTFETIDRPDIFVQCVFSVAEAGDGVVRKLLMQASPPCRQLAAQVLMDNTHPGVMRMLLGFLSLNLPYPRALSAISDRQDIEFATAMLRWLPELPSAVISRNLQQVEHIAWLDPYGDVIEMLPESLHLPLFRLIGYLGLPGQFKQSLREWILRHGSPAARDLALESLQSLGRGVLQSVVTEELSSIETDRRAWALGHVRDQKIPDAFSLLVSALDDDEDTIREVARDQLSVFDLEQMLDRLDDMSPEEARYSGGLLRKIDPDFADTLSAELTHPIRRRRIRGARGAVMLGLLPDVLPTVLTLLFDEDSLIRRTAVETLVHVPTAEVLQAVLPLEHDPSLKVRQAVIEVLQAWSQPGSTVPMQESL